MVYNALLFVKDDRKGLDSGFRKPLASAVFRGMTCAFWWN